MANRPAKAVITDPQTATKILRQYLRSNAQHVKLEGSQARFASPSSLASWYEREFGCTLDQGWFFRALNAARNNGVKIQKVDVGGVSHYRLAS